MLHMIAADAGAGPVDINWLSLVTTIVVFMLFFAVAATMVWPKILKGLDEREQKIREEIESAEAARAEAAESLARQEAALNEARREAKAMREQAKADAEAYARDLRLQAEAELDALRKQAHREVDVAREAAIKDLSAHAAELATAVAGRIIERELSSADQQDLVESSMKEMASAPLG
ncbi:MAG: F0F1 ATP synthase subunit B [Phycisphaerales bacterium]|nr:F0F1 ATP synthase subunit B [Phycisphaerales bacterium]